MSQFGYDKAYVMALEDRRFEAMLSNDANKLAPLLDDDVIYIHSSAVKDSKKAYLDSMRDGRLAYRAFRRFYDGFVPLNELAFIVTGRIGIDLELNGNPARLDNLFIAVWKRGSDDEWRMISWQSTPVPQRA